MPKNVKAPGKPLVVNFYAGPGCGKTVAAMELTAALKKAGYNVEYISEFAKDLVLENKLDLLKDQQYVTDGQYHRLDRIRKTTDIIVTDSPVLLGLVYGEMNGISEEYAKQIRSYYDSFDNFDMLMVRNRSNGFQQEGRVHDEKQSIELDGKIEEMLKKQDVFFGRYKRDDIAKTVERITTTYNRLYGVNKEEDNMENRKVGYPLPRQPREMSISDIKGLENHTVTVEAIQHWACVQASPATVDMTQYPGLSILRDNENGDWYCLHDPIPQGAYITRFSSEELKVGDTAQLGDILSHFDEKYVSQKISKFTNQAEAQEYWNRMSSEYADVRSTYSEINEYSSTVQEKNNRDLERSTLLKSDVSSARTAQTVSQSAQPKTQSVISGGRWQQLQLGNDCLVKTYENGTMFRVPPGCEYSGYVFFHPNKLVKEGTRIVDLQSDGREPCKTLLYTEDYSFTLKDNGKEIKVTGEQLKTALHRAEMQPHYENGREYMENCPGVLREQNKFICLRLTWDESKGKFAKMPINPHTGEAAKVNDPATWGSLEQANAALTKYGINGGIGYILTGDDNIVGIDLDLDKNTHVLTDNGKKILAQMKGKTYIEYSASGAVHIFGFGEKPGTWTRGAEDSNLEMYGGSKEGNRSLMLTGKVYDGKAVPMANIQSDIDKIYKKYFERPEIVRAATPQHESTLDERAVIEKLRAAGNSQKFERLMRGDTSDYGGDYSMADLGLCSLIAFYTRDEKVIDGIYRQSGLYSAQKVDTRTGRTEDRAKKWDSPRQNGTYGQQVISKAISSLSRTYSPGSSTFEPTEHLMIYKQTDKAVLVKVPKDGAGTLKEAVWLPKSRIELDKDSKRVLAADKRLIDEHHLPRFNPKPLSAKI